MCHVLPHSLFYNLNVVVVLYRKARYLLWSIACLHVEFISVDDSFLTRRLCASRAYTLRKENIVRQLNIPPNPKLFYVIAVVI